MKLIIVTLAFNNVAQVKRTLASVALQKVGPDRYLVIDGSSEPDRSTIKALAEKANAEYLWRKAHGVYPAMNDALRELEPDCFVWFINSSDWLASPDSVAVVRNNLRKSDIWLIGGLERYGDLRNPFHPIPQTGEQFVEYLTTGRIGFPHPSAIIAAGAIRSVGAFDVTYRIAADYALALKVASSFPPPVVLGEVLAVHDPTGLTSRHRFRNYLEKSQARRQLGVSWFAELRRLFSAIGMVAGLASSPSRAADENGSGELFGMEATYIGWGPEGLKSLDSWA